MYHQYFGLREEPFTSTIDPTFFFVAQKHRKVLVHLSHSILSRQGLISLTGEAGIGKTALITAVTKYFPASSCRFSVISNSTLSPKEIVSEILLGFDSSQIDSTRVRQLYALKEFIERGNTDGSVSTLVVDDADRFRPETLEEIGLLGKGNSFQIVLSGRNKLNDLLACEELRSLKSRVALHLRVEPIDAGEVEPYIQYRWKKARGAKPSSFSSEAAAEVGKWSKGVPNLINRICDEAMSVAFERKNPSVTVDHVIRAVTKLIHIGRSELPAAERFGSGNSPLN